MNTKTTVIYHRADFDGLFCREIARKFLPPDTEFIGWDFADPPLTIPSEGRIYILDLPVDRVFGYDFSGRTDGHPIKSFQIDGCEIIWIDHHTTSIETHPTDIPGYRIDGVAACRLAWQWFMRKTGGQNDDVMPLKEFYTARRLTEPLAVRLAGEYDVWDKRDPRAEVFQFGLRSRELTAQDWSELLDHRIIPETEKLETPVRVDELVVDQLLEDGRLLQRYQQAQDEGAVKNSAFLTEFAGLKFLTLNSARGNSLVFASRDVPETGHDALMLYHWNGRAYKVSLYHAAHRKELDLSAIAKAHGGGGHRGACGFVSPFPPSDLTELATTKTN